jgi:tetratricopeptide (TPR) repeat protein
MSKVPGQVVLDAENPWPGLHEFDERGKDFFNGRDQETADLLRLANDASLTVLFGGSGLGKTSLLLAGLVPNLRQQNKLSVYVRLDPRDRSAPLMEQAAAAFRAELIARGVDHPPFPDSQSLWEYVHRKDFELWSPSNQLLTPVFIFDQFEEMFTLGRENAEAVLKLREDLADLAENRVPALLARQFEHSTAAAPPLELGARHFKLLLSFREDFLADIEGWRGSIPSLGRNRFRLLPMNGHQALEAVTKTGGRLVDRTMGQAIVSFVAAARPVLPGGNHRAAAATAAPAAETENLAELTIEPALLSLVCTGLNERRKAAHKATIDQTLLSGTGLEIVAGFYQGCVRDLPDRARRFIEDELITEGGFRNTYSREDAIAQGFLSDQQLETLVKRRLLRVERHLGTDRIELVHDLLTSVVRTFRNQERARSRRRAYRWRMASGAVGGLAALIVVWVSWNFLQMRMLDNADKQRAQALAVASRKDYNQAITLFTDPLAVYQRTGDSSRLARALVDRGRLHALAGKQDKADEDFQRARDTARQAHSAGDEALALEGLASLASEEAAEMSLYEQAIERYKTVGDAPSIARLWESIATREEKRKQYEPATGTYRKALESYLVAGDRIGVTRVTEAIGRTEPWGFLLDLKRNDVFSMRGDRVAIGGGWGNVQNDVNFTSNFVSRNHLVISHREFRADDLRSTNGTTVNAVQLPYGLGTKLDDGDLIALANKEVLQFTRQPPQLPSKPSSAWAIFIDGSTRSYSYLTESVYSVGLTPAGQLRIESGDSASALLMIRHGPQKSELFDASIEWSVVVVFKENDYDYTQRILSGGQWSDFYDLPASLVKLSSDRKKILQQGPAFQIVTLTD